MSLRTGAMLLMYLAEPFRNEHDMALANDLLSRITEQLFGSGIIQENSPPSYR